MLDKSPLPGPNSLDRLAALGARLRAARKAQRVSAVAASEAAGGLTIHLSLTHSATSAAAVAVLERAGG